MHALDVRIMFERVLATPSPPFQPPLREHHALLRPLRARVVHDQTANARPASRAPLSIITPSRSDQGRHKSDTNCILALFGHCRNTEVTARRQLESAIYNECPYPENPPPPPSFPSSSSSTLHSPAKLNAQVRRKQALIEASFATSTATSSCAMRHHRVAPRKVIIL